MRITTHPTKHNIKYVGNSFFLKEGLFTNTDIGIIKIKTRSIKVLMLLEL